MTLINTQVGGTLSRGDVLASLYFSVAGNPTLVAASALADTVLRPNSTNTSVLSVSPQSPVLSGGWALVTTPGTDTVNTTLPKSGYAWTTVGNSGAFSNGTYNIGNDDYALISGTNAGAIGGGIPVISNEVFLTLTGFKSGSTSLALSQINGVVFTWNSTGQFSGPGISTAPEPATTGIVAMALLGLGFGRRFRRRIQSKGM
jgi:MYXO-CTERM domain-containing protein